MGSVASGARACCWQAVPSTPASSVHQPMSARPLVPPATAANGGIYQAAYNVQASTRNVPLFEDRRARYVGDTLIYHINEKTNASKKSNTNASRTGSTSFSVPTISGLPGKSLQGATLDRQTRPILLTAKARARATTTLPASLPLP